MKSIVRKFRKALGISKEPAAEPIPFDLLFQYFRDVLDSKNRAVETIADMADKLGGDYLFDIIYIRNAYAELYAAMQDSLRLFDNLTRNRYPAMREVFSRIDSQIRLMVDGMPPSGGDRIIFYSDISWDMARSVGGKNASLSELKNYAKINVPEGFAITTQAFDEFMAYNKLEGRIRSLDDDHASDDVLSALQEAIIGAEMPPILSDVLEKALAELRVKGGDNMSLAVRSSAEEEDSEYSFAGQFETLLNVPPDIMAVQEAYKRVVASLYSPKAAAYQKRAGYSIRTARMAVGCLVMVDAAASGVAYSRDPSTGADTLIINSTWGLGKSIVEGQVEADLYLVKKQPELSIVDKSSGNKSSMVVRDTVSGITTVSVPAGLTGESSLTDAQVLDIAGQTVLIEKYFRKPVDIEWAVDRDGTVVILQARPLRIIKKNDRRAAVNREELPMSNPLNALLTNKGTVVQRGVAAGRVYILTRMEELDGFPKGAVLVAHNDSSEFIRALPYASAIITDVGTPTSHMSSVCREFRVPTIVNAGDATKILKHGQEITVALNAEGTSEIYEGVIRELLDSVAAYSGSMDEVYEFRKKRYILRYISPLNLIDPLMDNFTPDGCRTMHDVLRFIHEKAVAELVEMARYGNDMVKKHAAVRLDLHVPLGIVVIDIGGGLAIDGKSESASPDQITSVPLMEIIRGLIYPGVWRSEVTSLRAADFLSSMMRMPDITSDTGDHVVYNVAVASRNM